MQTDLFLFKNTFYFKRSMINTTLKINSFILSLIFLFLFCSPACGKHDWLMIFRRL